MTGEKLSIENLSFGYSKKDPEILHKISFHAKEGDFIAVLGPNGVGKSTMFKCILGFYSNYSGDICIGEENLHTLSHKEIAKKIAYIPQSTYPTFNYDVLDVVLMGLTAQLSALASPKKEHIRKAEEALESLGISHLAHSGYGEISGGERQLVLIARALVQDAKIFIMDEPTANLDYGNQFRVMCRVANLAKQGYIILLSTHNPEHAFLHANRVLMFMGGKIIADGKPDDILTQELIRRVYNLETRIEEFTDEDGIHKMCIPVSHE